MKVPIIFLHGFLGTKRDWDPVISHLGEYECIPIDLPGHGTMPFTKNFDLPNLPKMHIVGYSMGGRLAMQYAEKFEDKVASLTILSAHTGLISGKEERLLLDEKWANILLKSYDTFLDEWYKQPIFGGYKPNLEERKKHNPIELAKALLFYSLGNQPLFKPKNAHIIVGEKDTKYRNLYPDAIVVPKAAHMIHLENPEFVAKGIRYVVEKSR